MQQQHQCRACLGVVQLQLLSSNHQLQQLFRDITHLELSNDPVAWICTECADHLQKHESFLVRCKDADNFLRLAAATKCSKEVTTEEYYLDAIRPSSSSDESVDDIPVSAKVEVSEKHTIDDIIKGTNSERTITKKLSKDYDP